MKHYKRLPLKSLHNARDLGGYPCPEGMTSYGVFLRTEIARNPTEEDLALLREFGVTMNLDFRSGMELRRTPDPLAGLPWMEYVHIPMFDEFAVQGADVDKSSLTKISSEFSWGQQYVFMAENHRHWFKDVLETMARAEGAVLYHCTTGKDRTGMITAALLGICGVSDMDIIADYCVSQVYLMEMYRFMIEEYPEDSSGMTLDNPFLSTAPKNMESFLGHINKKYGSMTEFLFSCGVTEETVNILRGRLLNSRLNGKQKK